jgi:hypothetical protein
MPQGASGDPSAPTPVLVAVGAPVKQDRLTVAFRLILAIPHLIALYALGIAASVIVVIGWFAALFTGRLPAFAADYLSGYLRWYFRVRAYLLLLTDSYPPFTLDDAEYPVRLAVQPGKLNRLAVLFRFILVIPAWVVVIVVTFGIETIVAFVAWLIVLIGGRLPESLHQAFTAVLRYEARFYGYSYLLTAAYPGGLLGDRPEHPEVAVTPTQLGASGYEPPAAPGYEPPPAPAYEPPPAPAYEPPPAPGYEPPPAPGYGAWNPSYPQPLPGYGVAEPAPPPQPASWRLVLSSEAKRLLGLFIAVGLVTAGGYGAGMGVLFSSAASKATSTNAINQVSASYQTLSSALASYQRTTAGCKSSARPLACVTAADKQVASAFTAFANAVHATPMPSGSAATASTLDSDATHAAQIFTQLGESTTIPQYESTVTSSGLQQVLSQFDSDYSALGTSLNAS